MERGFETEDASYTSRREHSLNKERRYREPFVLLWRGKIKKYYMKGLGPGQVRVMINPASIWHTSRLSCTKFLPLFLTLICTLARENTRSSDRKPTPINDNKESKSSERGLNNEHTTTPPPLILRRVQTRARALVSYDRNDLPTNVSSQTAQSNRPSRT